MTVEIKEIAAKRKGPPSVMVNLSQEDFDILQQFAHRSGTSVANVMRAGAMRLVVQVEYGEVAPEALTEFRNGVRIGHA